VGYVGCRRRQPSSQHHIGTAVRTAKTSSASWDAFDVGAFVDEVLAELSAMEADGTKPTRSDPKPALTGRRCARRSWRSGACASAACSGA
jgi:hypothetical protein